MKIPQTKAIKLVLPAIAVFSIFACTKDSDLLADYVASDIKNAQLFAEIVQNDYYFATKGSPIILDVLANDGFSNPDKVKIVEVSQPSNGTVTINEDKTLTYTPGANSDGEPLDENDSTAEESDNDETTSSSESVVPDVEEEEPQTNEQPKPEAQPEPNEQPEEEVKPETQPEPEPQPKAPENPEPNEEETPKKVEENEPAQEEAIKEEEPKAETPEEEETDDNFNYKVEVEEEDGSVSEQEGTVTVTTKELDYGILKAFPTAYGGGSNATGARASSSSTVYHVTNLNESGKGSFKDAVSQSNRYIVFDVSGTIILNDNFNSRASNLTIAGQTAPAGGITITGDGYNTFQGNNIIIRYVTFRPDFTTRSIDGMSFVNASNFILDHCSISWGSDEVSSMEVSCKDGTYQRNLIAEGNKTGTIMGNSDKPYLSENLSANNNLWYNISHRFPNPSSNGRLDVINNVVYNWGYRLSRTQGSVQINVIGNYYLRQRHNSFFNQMNKVDHRYGGAIPQIHASGNLMMPNYFTDANADNWSQWSTFGTWSYKGTSYSASVSKPAPRDFQKHQPHAPIKHAIPIQSARDAFKDVTTDVGNNKRIDGNGQVIRQVDKIDAIFLKNVVNDTPVNYGSYKSNTSIPNSQHYRDFQNSKSRTPFRRHPSNYDSDRDGMPDAWEIQRGSDPNTKDHNQDVDGNGYTNLEEYINLVDLID